MFHRVEVVSVSGVLAAGEDEADLATKSNSCRYKEKASAHVRFDYAGRYFLLSHLKRFCRRVCQILLGPIMWSCYVLIMRSPAIGICKKRLRSNGNRDIILPSAAGECQPLLFSGAPGISPSRLL